MILSVWHKIRRMWRAAKSVAKKCGCDSILDCPYHSTDECDFDKTDCHLVLDKNKKRKTKKKTQRKLFWASFCFAVIYILVSIIAAQECCEFCCSKTIYTILSGICISIVTATIISLCIDFPSKLQDYEYSFISALSSNNYLKSLDEDRLSKLRNDITRQLHKANAPYMAHGLITIDQKICELLRQPYYDRYRQMVNCSLQSNIIQKRHIIDYKLINPYGVNKKAREYINLSNLVLGNDLTQNPIKDLKIICRIDNIESKNYSIKDGTIVLKTEPIKDNNMDYYKSEVFIAPITNNETTHGIPIDFNDNIQVHIEYIIDVCVEDRCFTKRLQHPTKNFRLDYSYSGPEEVQLYGQIFGTELKQSDFIIRNLTEKSICLETFNWLLPDNGAIVILLDKQTQQTQQTQQTTTMEVREVDE